jgi:hypothetical protein
MMRGVLHSPRRDGDTELIRIEGCDLAKAGEGSCLILLRW